MKPFMPKSRREAIKREEAENKREEEARRRRRSSSPSYGSYLTDPTHPMYAAHHTTQTNHFYPDGSYTSETSSGTDYGSRGSASYTHDSGSYSTGSSSSYDSGSSGSSYDSGSSGGGSYGGE